MGTVGYMSPEQVRGQAADHRSDLFSFGLILYELLSGQRESPLETLTAIAKEDAPELPDTVPAALRQTVGRCLEKDQARRFQSAADLAFGLRAMAGSGPAAGVTTKGPTARAWKLATALVSAAALALAALLLRDTSAELRPLRLTLSPPPGMSFRGLGAAVSPDGKMVALVAGSAGNESLWIRPLDAFTAREIPGTAQARYPFWSPDGKTIGFFADDKLKRVDLGGGAPQIVCDAPNTRGGAWSRAGVIIFSHGGSGLQRVPATGGQPALLTTPDASNQVDSHRWPQFLPDGRRFLYWARTGNTESTGVYVSSLDAPQQRAPIVTSSRRAEYAGGPGGEFLFWVRGETLVAQRFDGGRLRVEGEAAPLAERVGAGAGGCADFSASGSGVLIYGSETYNKRQMQWYSRDGQLLGKGAARSWISGCGWRRMAAA